MKSRIAAILTVLAILCTHFSAYAQACDDEIMQGCILTIETFKSEAQIQHARAEALQKKLMAREEERVNALIEAPKCPKEETHWGWYAGIAGVSLVAGFVAGFLTPSR